MNKHTQHQSQLSYFGSEFSQLSEYRLVPWQKTYVERILSFLPKRSTRSYKILDIATGSGYAAVELAKIGYSVSACDLTRESIDHLRKVKKQLKLHNLQVFISQAEQIKLPDNSVDFIIANAILEHIYDESAAITEWKRILKPKGKIFITVPLKLQYVWPIFWPIWRWYDNKIGHLCRYDVSDLERKFSLAAIYKAYSGHWEKYMGVIFSYLTHSSLLDEWAEKADKKKESSRWGATNVIAILTKK